MSANTGYAKTFEGASKIAHLSAQAMEYIALGNRDANQVERLEKALQLFKEDRLGDVLSFRLADTAEKDAVLDIELRTRRDAFKRDIARVGELEIEMAFYDSLSNRTRRGVESFLLRDLVLRSEQRLMREDHNRMGKVSVAELVEALAKKGLTLSMTPTEVEECFGPVEAMPFQIFVHKDGGGGNRVQCKVVLQSVVSGEFYESADGQFKIPSGDYIIIEPVFDKWNHPGGIISLKTERHYRTSCHAKIYI